MNTKRIFLTVKAIALTLTLLALVALPVAPAAAQAGDPGAVVTAYLEAVVAKDLDAALALVADNITHTDTHAPPGLPSVTQGKADFGAYLKGYLDDPGYRLEYANAQANGDTVTWTTQEWFDANNLPPSFPLPIESHVQAVVANGQIISILLDNDPAWLEKLYVAIPPEAIDPASVVQLWTKAMNAHDLDQTLAYFADDATLTDTHPLPGSKNPLTGAAELRALFENDIKSNVRLELSNFSIPEPDHVKFFSQYWADPSAFPPDYPLPIESNMEAIVKEGKITSLTIAKTPEWLARLGQPTSLPATGGEMSRASIWLISVGGVMLLALGLTLLARKSRQA
jgi:ketosteroid isomerase-like protein